MILRHPPLSLAGIPVVVLVAVFFLCGGGHSAKAQAVREVKFGDVTAKFVRNMKVLRTLTDNPSLGQMIDVVVKKAEDLQSFNNDKNADEKRYRIMRQMDVMVRREGIQDSDQKKLEKLKQELRDLDPTGNFQKAKGEMSRSLGELQNILGQSAPGDPQTEDVLRLVRLHVNLYNRALAKMN